MTSAMDEERAGKSGGDGHGDGCARDAPTMTPSAERPAPLFGQVEHGSNVRFEFR
jgi:hypothetical protein